MGSRAWRAVGAAAVLAVAAGAWAQPRGRGWFGGPGGGRGSGARCGWGPSSAAASGAALSPLEPAVQSAVAEALADERRTESLYAAIVAAHGEVRPFSNAIWAEGRHAAHLEATLSARGLAIPARPAPATPPGGTVAEACAAAVEGERANVALYDRLLAAGSLPDDVRGAFERNRRASLEHHLPAFERCAARAGGRR